MTITFGYCTLAQLKQRIGVAGTDANRDTDLELIVQSASRQIDSYCNRTFYTTAAAVARYFTPVSSRLCFIDDMQTLTSIKLDYDGDQTFETTLATTDYWTEPRNETPKTSIRMKPQGAEHFTLRDYSVEVTATWGYNATASIPDVVFQACITQANRLWNRRGAPFGVAGTNEMGQALVIAKLDPDVEIMLNPLRRLV